MVQKAIDKEIEHIIIDGNSADKTVSIVKQYSYINKIISEPDDGVYDAMNKGINIARGDIIGFLNSDDFYVKEDFLSRAVGVFEDNPSLEACYIVKLFYNSYLKSHCYFRT